MSNYIIKIPTQCTPEEADRWRVVAEALKQLSSTTSRVNSPTSGLSAVQGKAKINKYDSTAEYLEDKIVASNSTTFVQSNDGLGAKEIKIHSKVIENTTVPSDIITGELFFDTDAPFGTPFTIGDGLENDMELNFDTDTNDGSIIFMGDEDYFKYVDHILLDAATKLYLRDTDIYINSTDDGYLDLYADTGIRVTKAPRGTTSLYRRYYHLALGSANPGASGATWVVASATTTGGWRLTNAAWLLRAQADVHSDWDGATDLMVSVNFMVNVDNTGGADADTVDLKITTYYKGVGDTACKSQVVEVPTTVGKSAQYKQFKANFTIDWNYADNVVETGDIISIILNLETDSSEVDDIVVTSMEFYYQTAHVGVESGDV